MSPKPRRAGSSPSNTEVSETRDAFWHNVVQEFLTSLSILYARHEAGAAETDNIFDGRLAVITSLGTRIPIGGVYPLFACSLSATGAERTLSREVECSVFQIETPEGESFTLPLSEVRSFHALSAELIERIKAETGAPDDEGESMPFGFAAFTSLARERSTLPSLPFFTGPDFPPP